MISTILFGLRKQAWIFTCLEHLDVLELGIDVRRSSVILGATHVNNHGCFWQKRSYSCTKDCWGCKKACFWKFIDQLCEKLKQDQEENGKPYCLLLDNCPAHTDVEEVIEEHSLECIPQRLPPYSPEMNAIELTFSPIKQKWDQNCEHWGLLNFLLNQTKL